MPTKIRSIAIGQNLQKITSSIKPTLAKRVRKMILYVEKEQEEEEYDSYLVRKTKEIKKLAQDVIKESIV